jgi:LCP family protein required for cell wall assembly
MLEDLEKTEEQNIAKDFISQEKKRPRWRRFAFGGWILFLAVLLLGLGGSLVYKTSFTFSQMQTGDEDLGALILDESMATPTPESDRTNILLLGIRGEEDPNGGLLTDTMIILSIKKSTGQTALISIPRDLYVSMPGKDYKEKINFAYALGFEKKGAAGGLLYSKIVVSQATGLYINRAISVNHAAFKEVVDILGGITITLDKPMIEDQQWIDGGDIGPSPAFFIRTDTASSSEGMVKKQKWVFEIPAGTSKMDGNTTLYFVRARYSSSDFDRARRQQLALGAIKEKALSLGVLGNPIKIYQILESLGRNVKTDMPWDEMKSLISLAGNFDSTKIAHKVFDTTPEGLLYSARASNGAYILLPQGDDFSKIKEASKNIFTKQ